MRLGDRIPPAVSRWRAILTDERVARAMPRPDITPHLRAILGTLDQGRASARINADEAITLRAIAENPDRDLAELTVLLTVLCELRGLPSPKRHAVLR